MSTRDQTLREHSKLSKKKKKLSNYHKKQMLAMLKTSNCHPNQLEAISSRCRVDEDFIKNFINTQAQLSQSRLEHTLRSQTNKHFLNLDQCARNLSENNESATDNTLPVTLEAIANHEALPEPAKMNGIDLKVLYRTLANMTAGYPVEEIPDGPTKDFLKTCYTELMGSVTEVEPKTFKEILHSQDDHTNPVYSWLCNSDYSQYITKIFKDIADDNDE